MRSVIKLKTNLVKGFSDKAFDIAYCSTERVRRLKMVKNNSRHLYRFMVYSRSERARARERERERESESESELFTGDTSKDNHSPGPVFREVSP